MMLSAFLVKLMVLDFFGSPAIHSRFAGGMHGHKIMKLVGLNLLYLRSTICRAQTLEINLNYVCQYQHRLPKTNETYTMRP